MEPVDRRCDKRTSPDEVKKEIEGCYEIIDRLGRGAVYLGASLMGPDHPYYSQVSQLAKEIAIMLGCTTWSGAGPGLMDAVIKGALEVGKPIGGLKVVQEAGEWTSSNIHPYLTQDKYFTCRFFSARKHGLVDAAVRNKSTDRTAVIALPGRVGTLDEIFEFLALIQLERIGSEFPIPFLVMNYDGFYSKLLEFLDVIQTWFKKKEEEEDGLMWTVCNNNAEALAVLAKFYDLPLSNGTPPESEKVQGACTPDASEKAQGACIPDANGPVETGKVGAATPDAKFTL